LRKLVTPWRLAAAGLVLLALVAGGLLLVPAGDTYIFLPDRARLVEPLVQVEGGKAPMDGGGIYFVDVIVRRATWVERLFPSIREGATLVPAHAINPSGVSDEVRRSTNLRAMTRSQSIAAAVALKELGYDVTARPAGALISGISAETPAAAKLQPGDVVVALDGHTVKTPSDLRRLVRRGKPGDAVTLDVRRGGKLEKVELETIPDPRNMRRPLLGVLVDQEARVKLPISVRIDAGSVGGPSAGLAFALDVMEELGRDVDRGHKVAVTGEIELDGDVTSVGGLRQKTIGARRTKVDVFLVPAGDNAAEARRYSDGLRVIPVRSFQQALQALATLPENAKD
jgi:Lon-like protease